VFDYAPGKADWAAAGLPLGGTKAARPTAASVARRDVPTCDRADPIGEVRERVAATSWDACVVVNGERVVLGLLRSGELSRSGDGPVEAFMRPGPSTFRPDVPIDEMARYMTDHDLVSSPITTSDGRLVGLLRREDAVREAGSS
jgi:CBS domain-containing protein